MLFINAIRRVEKAVDTGPLFSLCDSVHLMLSFVPGTCLRCRLFSGRPAPAQCIAMTGVAVGAIAALSLRLHNTPTHPPTQEISAAPGNPARTRNCVCGPRLPHSPGPCREGMWSGLSPRQDLLVLLQAPLQGGSAQQHRSGATTGGSLALSGPQGVCWSQDFPSLWGARWGFRRFDPRADGTGSWKLLEDRSHEETGHLGRNGRENTDLSSPRLSLGARPNLPRGQLHEPRACLSCPVCPDTHSPLRGRAHPGLGVGPLAWHACLTRLPVLILSSPS